MSVTRTINPFTCLRDKEQLEAYLACHQAVLLAVGYAKETRAKIRHYESISELRHIAALYYEQYDEDLQHVSRNLDGYRAWQQITRMTIKEAQQHLDRINEYISEYY